MGSEDRKRQTVLITGAAGMIGSETVRGFLDAGYYVIGIDRIEKRVDADGYKHYVVDLGDKGSMQRILEENTVHRIVHMAALAHTTGGIKYTWDDYMHYNVECAKNVFELAGSIPVLFISTVDVYGFTMETVGEQMVPHPVSDYAKSKVMAEEECKKLSHYTIYRFSPVYTETVKRDIQKRYYLKYPNFAYQIGKGQEYEVLDIKNAVQAMVSWCNEEVKNTVRIIKDSERLKTVEFIRREKIEGRARILLRFPYWMVKAGYRILKLFFGENKYTYLLHKAVFPIRSEESKNE